MNDWSLDFNLNEIGKMILCALAFILVFCLLASLIPQMKDENKLYPTWKVGSIDENGVFNKKDKSSLVSQLLIINNGLKIKIDNDKTVTYQIILYDSDENFLGVIKDNCNENVVLSYGEIQKTYSDAMYFRVILKQIDKSGYINIFEKDKYSRYITIYETNYKRT